jgi:hypothetical protein
MPGGRVACHACRYYHVTWDERFPHGCRRMGFKSFRIPSDEVRRAMQGSDCRLFEPKPDRKPPLENP